MESFAQWARKFSDFNAFLKAIRASQFKRTVAVRIRDSSRLTSETSLEVTSPKRRRFQFQSTATDKSSRSG